MTEKTEVRKPCEVKISSTVLKTSRKGDLPAEFIKLSEDRKKIVFTDKKRIGTLKLIVQRGLNTLGHSGIYAWGETPSWAVGVNLSSNGDSVNQESPSFNDRHKEGV